MASGLKWRNVLPIVQFSSAAEWCPTVCDPINLSTPGLPIHHQLPEFTQTHVLKVKVFVSQLCLTLCSPM